MFKKVSKNKRRISPQSGFSVIEMIIVLLVISIMVVFASRFTSAKVYEADRQANVFLDVFEEARQRAVTQQETMRVEINESQRSISLITENEAGDGSDDQKLKTLPLASAEDVVFGSAPENMEDKPDEPTPVPELNFSTPVSEPLTKEEYYALLEQQGIDDPNDLSYEEAQKLADQSNPSDRVATFRFLRNGNVVDAGLNDVGDGAIVTGATIYFWSPSYNEDGTVRREASVLRAITLLGSSGTVNYWKCRLVEGKCLEWEK